MKQEILQQVLEGYYIHTNSFLNFSCAKLELSLAPGQIYEGTFRISANPDHATSGFITTSDSRMECLTPEFSGSDEEIAFCFHAEHMQEGEVLKGVFNVVSNQGEYYLPFLVTVEHMVLQSSLGPIKNLFHFANLAKSNWKEAIQLFYSKDFQKIFQGTDEKVYDSYRALSSQSGNEQNMEEFLIRINKKQKVEYLLEQPELVIDVENPNGDLFVAEQTLPIIRNGWGYTALQVECDGDFLFTEKTFLGEEDFIGNYCRLLVFLDNSRFRKGRNYGQVVLYNSYVCLTVPVVVKVGETDLVVRENVDRKRVLVQLMEYYLAFRMAKISRATWIRESLNLVEHLSQVNGQDVEVRLYQAQLLIADEKYSEAGWLLDHSADLLEKYYEKDSIYWAYYWYLTTLVNREDSYVNQVTDEVDRIYRMDRSRWQAAWLLLYLAEEYNKSSSGKWMFLEKQFINGCTSPIMYAEAVFLLNSNPALLRKLDEYEQQVLYYGARNQLLSDELIEQMLYLFGKVREYNGVLFRILKKLYERKPEVRLVQEICALLIKGNRVGLPYFEWYAKGVDAQLRITNLYEYYCMSLDLNKEQEIPKPVLMYFAYQSNLDSEHCAYLYYYVYQHRHELADIYDGYRVRIGHFVEEQLERQNINRYLAKLYISVISAQDVNADNASAIERLVFMNKLTVEDERLKRVYVYHAGILTPQEYFIADKTAWIALYGTEYTICFEDAYQNRFICNVDYTLERMMLPGQYIRPLGKLVTDSIPFDLYMYELERKEITSDTLERALRLVYSEQISSKIRNEIVLDVLQYYNDTDKTDLLDAFLESVSMEDMTSEDKQEIVRYMVLRGKYDSAFHWVEEYGPDFIDAKTLVRLIGPRLENDDLVESDIMTEATLSAFRRGKYNGRILEYLTKYFEGLTKDMRDIWKAACSYEVDCYEMAERMLLQMMYTDTYVGERMDIFRYYVAQGGRQDVEETFVRRLCEDYFVRERIVDPYVFHMMDLAHQRGDYIDRICKLTYLKYYAENPSEFGEEQMPVAEEFLTEMIRDGIHLNFFRDYECFADRVKVMNDRTIIEYKAAPGVKARIHYVLVHENGESDEYCFEYMQEIYPGVFFKEFVLFFGENLQYYIIEEDGEREHLTESSSIRKSDIVNGSGANRYDLINDMIISKTLQDYDTLDQLMQEYYRKEYLNEALFKLV